MPAPPNVVVAEVGTPGPPGSGITGAQYADLLRNQGQVYNVVSYGADPGGTTDSTAALQAALADAQTAGTGVLFLPAGIYLLNATLHVNKRVSIIGCGAPGSKPDGEAFDAEGGTILKWTGGAATMLAVDGPVRGITLAHFGLYGNGTAQYGIVFDRLQRSVVEHVRVADCTVAGILMGTWSTTADDNSMWNTVLDVGIEKCPSALRLDGNGAGTANCCHNTFVNLALDYGLNAGDGVSGLYLGNCDNNAFLTVWTFRRTGTGLGLDLTANSRSNYFFHYQASAGGVTARASSRAVIFGYDRENGQPAPTIESGALLTWTEDGNNANGWHLSRRLYLQPTTNFSEALTIARLAGQVNDLLDICDENNNPLGGFDASGRVVIWDAASRTASATAGTASALPSQPAGYMTINEGGTLRKVPYYNP